VALQNNIRRIAIGSFDGIHLGHQALLDQVDALVIIERNSGYLTPGYRRSAFTPKICFFYHFDKIRSLTPQGFIDQLKEDFPALETIVVGYDFHFGRDKAGDAQMLKTLCNKEIVIVPQVRLDDIPVHSRTIKTFLREGKVTLANQLLGRNYTIIGNVISGQGLGQKELVPTLNLHVEEYQLPLEGVYATRTCIDGKWLNSVSFLGHRVTTDDSYAVETHILENNIGKVEGEIALEFIEFIRENRKFDSLEALKTAIKNDISMAKTRFTV
jgi:riboflavin kinase/FMN adenylyltransferase